MPFHQRFEHILLKSNDYIYKLNLNSNIVLNNFNPNMQLVSSNNILNGQHKFNSLWFDIDEKDNIYGLVNTDDGILLYIYITSKYIFKNILLNYGPDISSIKFPYIKKLNNVTHIIYYEISNILPHFCKLIHYYQSSNKWIKNIIDTTHYNVLSNFNIKFIKSEPAIFYLKIINGYEQLFTSEFNLETSLWSNPQQITHSNNKKIYLSCVTDKSGFYHIVFSENKNDKYLCMYITGFFKKGKFNVTKCCSSNNTIACMFPNISVINDNIYIQWIEYNHLYTTYSNNYGSTWTPCKLNNSSCINSFQGYNFKFNKPPNCSYNTEIFFALCNSVKPLGISDFKNYL